LSPSSSGFAKLAASKIGFHHRQPPNCSATDSLSQDNCSSLGRREGRRYDRTEDNSGHHETAAEHFHGG
jgi:hypothetical protein